MPSKKPINPLGQVSDQDKAHTPDKLRRDDAVWKEHDMPDESTERNRAKPEDYERPVQEDD